MKTGYAAYTKKKSDPIILGEWNVRSFEKEILWIGKKRFDKQLKVKRLEQYQQKLEIEGKKIPKVIIYQFDVIKKGFDHWPVSHFLTDWFYRELSLQKVADWEVKKAEYNFLKEAKVDKANLALTGIVSQFGLKRVLSLGNDGKVRKNWFVKIDLDLRLIDVETGKLLADWVYSKNERLPKMTIQKFQEYKMLPLKLENKEFIKSPFFKIFPEIKKELHKIATHIYYRDTWK